MFRARGRPTSRGRWLWGRSKLLATSFYAFKHLVVGLLNDSDVFSDITYPFCYIGKQHLEGALAELGVSNAEIRFQSFELDPN